MRKIRCLVFVAFALGAPAADACSVGVPWQPFINVVRMTGPEVEGLRWARFYNVLDYVGDQRVQVSVLRHGVRVPVVRWEGGQECLTEAGRESCRPNTPGYGASFEAFFDHWREAAPAAASLRRVYLPLVVQVAGRELRLTLRSQPVRNTRKLQLERAGRYAAICARMDIEQ